MTDTSDDPIWPREIWAFERAELEHTGTHVFDVVATVPRWDGDEERERNHQCYIDKDIFDSQEKYYKVQMEALAAERDALKAKLDVATEALEHISSPTQTKNLLWWQMDARTALSAINGDTP